jgi:UDP-N-acetyl-alpha-D-muramoyl-L-alanyl-L-glutamate epimerase
MTAGGLPEALPEASPEGLPGLGFNPADWTRFHHLGRTFTRTTDTVTADLHYCVARSNVELDAPMDDLLDALQHGGGIDPAGQVIRFTERYVFHLATEAREASPAWATRWNIAERLLTHLWVVAGLSYYKASAAAEIRVHGRMSADDLALHQLLLTRGLGEYCFINGLDPQLLPAWHVDLAETEPERSGAELGSGPLVPVGGGKDSCVTIEALRAAGRAPTLVTVRRFPIIQDVIDASGLPDVAVERIIDPAIVELNNLGARNGHVPATAIVSFAALIAAVLGGHDSLVMSNERSASEGNVEYRGVAINHQWAKSDEAESAVAAAVARITPELRWFSLLRPLSELDISQRFAATCQRYFDSFSSCNRTQRIDPARRVTRWCGECPKCQFVYLALCTSLPRAEVERIWGAELYASSPMEGFRALLGLSEWKPFECVGEHLECRVALASIIERDEWSDHPTLRYLAAEVRAGSGWPTDADVCSVYALHAAPLVAPDYRGIIHSGPVS